MNLVSVNFLHSSQTEAAQWNSAIVNFIIYTFPHFDFFFCLSVLSGNILGDKPMK